MKQRIASVQVLVEVDEEHPLGSVLFDFPENLFNDLITRSLIGLIESALEETNVGGTWAMMHFVTPEPAEPAEWAKTA